MENPGNIIQFVGDNLNRFLHYTAFANLTVAHGIMILIGLALIALAILKEYQPLLLIPVGFGILIANIPLPTILNMGTMETGNILYYMNFGLVKGIYPPLIFLGLGAIADFSSLISNPKLILIGIAAQLGIFAAYTSALALGFEPSQAGAIGLIGAADATSAIFLSAKLSPGLIGIIAVSAYTYMALVPVIQPPFMKMLTTGKERMIRMKPPRVVSRTERVLFPILGLLLTCFLVPAAIPLLGMLFFGNLIKESGVTKRFAETIKGTVMDIVTILIGLAVGTSAQAETFLTFGSLKIFVLGILSFIIATMGGVIFVKLLNIFLKKENRINPLIGNAGVSAIPDSAKVSQTLGLKYDNTNHLLMHAMGPNMAAVIGSALAAGVLLSFLS
jgi:carboxybiotin decarboxylase